MEEDKIKKLLNNLHYGNSNEVQEASIRELISIDEDQICLLLEQDTDCYYWANIVKILAGIGYPKIKSVLPALVMFLQDLNWPGSEEIAEFLLTLGEPVIPLVKEVLSGNDTYWQYYVMEKLIDKWPKSMVIKLESELVNLLKITDLENGVQIDALRILFKNELRTKEGLLHAYKTMKESYAFLIEKLKDNEQYFN